MNYSRHQLSVVEKGEFAGFEIPDASFIWCPNQFFDVCMVNCPRGVVRLVGYVLYETLKWIDKQGNPNTQPVSVPYTELMRNANISHNEIRKSLQAAVVGNFIELVEEGRVSSRNERGVATKVRLKWSTGDAYISELRQFDGFFARRGCRTQIPHSFFTWVVPRETQGVTKIVGTVLRHTVGWETQFGTRVEQAPLSRDFIRSFANIGSDQTVERSLQSAINQNYIVCVKKGSFVKKQASVYAPKWLVDAEQSKDSHKIVAKEHSENRSQGNHKNVVRGCSENRSDINKPEIILKQTTNTEVASVVVLLCEFGFEEKVAQHLAESHSHEVIRQQLEWMPKRKINSNKLGFARKAIEENWCKPVTRFEMGERIRKRQPFLTDEELLAKTGRQKRRSALLTRWSNASEEQRKQWHQMAIEKTKNQRLKQFLLMGFSEFEPPKHVLNQMALELGLEPIAK